MTEEQKIQMDIAYKEQVDKGLITDLNGAVGFKLGYELALKQGQELPISNVVDSVPVLREEDLKIGDVVVYLSKSHGIKNLTVGKKYVVNQMTNEHYWRDIRAYIKNDKGLKYALKLIDGCWAKAH